MVQALGVSDSLVACCFTSSLVSWELSDFLPGIQLQGAQACVPYLPSQRVII